MKGGNVHLNILGERLEKTQRNNSQEIITSNASKNIFGLCHDRTSACEKGRKDKDNCIICEDVIKNKIKDPHMKITLNEIFYFSIEQFIEYILYNKLWERYSPYVPNQDNKLATVCDIKTKEWEDLTLGQQYYVIESFIIELAEKKEHKKLIIDPQNIKKMNKKKIKKIYGQNIKLDDLESKDTQRYNVLKKYFTWNSISEYINYNKNILATKDINELPEDIKAYSFNILKERPSNETFIYNGDTVLLNLTKGLCDIKLSTYDKQNQEDSIRIGDIPELTIKEKSFDTLSDQVNYYTKNIGALNAVKKGYGISDTPQNLHNLAIFYNKVRAIEKICQEYANNAQDYVQEIFGEIKEELIKITGENKKNDFVIAPNKRVHRAVEKNIISHNGDITKATDNCRATNYFNDIESLQKGTMDLINAFKIRNKNYFYKKKALGEKPDPSRMIKNIYFDDKFGNLFAMAKKSSGYRDGKFLIQFGDGNVIELMLQLKDMEVAKNTGFTKINEKSIIEYINYVQLTPAETKRTNDTIDVLDFKTTKRGKNFGKKLPHIDKLDKNACLPADFLYNIYRNMDEYKDKRYDYSRSLPFEKNIKCWSLVEKLQFLEREIYQWGYKLSLDKSSKKVDEKIKIHKNRKLRGE